MPSHDDYTREIERLTRQLGIARGETAIALAHIDRLEKTILEMQTIAQAGMHEIRLFDESRAMHMPEANPLNKESA